MKSRSTRFEAAAGDRFAVGFANVLNPAALAAGLLLLAASPVRAQATGAQAPLDAQELSRLLARHSGHAALVFTETRDFPLHPEQGLLNRWLPQLQADRTTFTGSARPGEFFVFQLGLYAVKPAGPLGVVFSELNGDAGIIPVTVMRCLSLGGTNYLGQPFRKEIRLQQGQMQALWVGVEVPVTAKGIYTGTAQVQVAPGDSVPVAVTLHVAGEPVPDHGDSIARNLTRLRWLDSTVGTEPTITQPFKAVQANGRVIKVLGRELELDEDGLPARIASYFSPANTRIEEKPREVLARPTALVIQAKDGVLVRQKTFGSLTHTELEANWQAQSLANGLRTETSGRLDYTGSGEIRIRLIAERELELSDVRLEVPFREDAARYFMGLNRQGGRRPAEVRWHWDVTKHQDCFWLGDVNAGLMLRFKDAEYLRPPVNIYYSFRPLRLPESWGNHGRGGIDLAPVSDAQVLARAYSGPRSLKAGETLDFVFELYLTPFRTIDTEKQWAVRFVHVGGPGRNSIDEAVAKADPQHGPNVVNVHHASFYSPYINYPYSDESFPAFCDLVKRAHAKGVKLRVYYTTREITQNMPELFPLHTFNGEIILPGPGREARTLLHPKGPHRWLADNLREQFIPAWEAKVGPPYADLDLSVITTPDSRWNNFYLEGLRWLVEKSDFDGMYIDDTALDATSLRRARRILDSRPGRLIDLHSWNHFNEWAGFVNNLTIYMEILPYLDRLWLGEGFDANAVTPDFWLVEMSGLPFGLMSEMLDGANPWRGMVFGETARLPWSGDPRGLWKVWDQYGIQGTEFLPFFVDSCPVKTGQAEVLATVYRKPGRSFIALGSWAKSDTQVRLNIDWAALGLDSTRARIYAPAIEKMQPERSWKPGEAIPVPSNKGWFLVVDEVQGKLPHATTSGSASAAAAPIKAFCIDFNWGEGGPNGFAKPGLWADASPEQHVAWYTALGCNVIQTFAVSCNGYAWYRGGPVPPQPGLQYDFLTDVVRLGHQRGMKVMGYFCVGANTRWGQAHTNLSYGTPSAPHIPLTSEYLDYLCASIQDALHRSGMDGFMIDWVWNPGDLDNTRLRWLSCEQQMYQELFNEPFPGKDNITPERELEFRRRAIDRCWERIHAAAKAAKPDCVIWLSCCNVSAPMVVNSRLFREVDWLMNEATDPKVLDQIASMKGPDTRLVQCVVGWGDAHDAQRILSGNSNGALGIYGFTKPGPNSLPLPVAEYKKRAISSFQGNDRNLAVLARAFNGVPIESESGPTSVTGGGGGPTAVKDEPIDRATLDAWSAPYRGWHYYPDPVIPSDLRIPGCEKFHNFDVPTVYQLPGQPAKWFLSFIGFDGSGYNSFVAESTNLVNWTNPRLAMGFGPTNEFDHGGCVIGAFLYESYDIPAARLLKQRDGKFWTLYGCYPRQGGYELRPGYEGVAVSDDGLVWRRAKNSPILSVYDPDCGSWEKDCIYQPWLVEEAGHFYDFYNAANGGTEQMGGATSTNLLDWRRYAVNPVVRVRPGGFDSQFCSDGKVFRDGDHWVMFYFGVGHGGAHIMAAFSRDLVHWTSHPEPLYRAGGHPGGLDSQYAHKISLVRNPANATYYLYYCAVGNKGRCIGLLTSRPLAPATAKTHSPTSPQQSNEQLHATVVIDPDSPTTAYSPMLFGGFIEHFDGQIYGGLFDPGSPLSDGHGFRKDVIAALKELKLSIVRWPGGCFASGYHWKDGVGKQRKPVPDPVWGVTDPNTFGTAEFVAWCRLVGCEPYICSNAGNGTPEEMRDWVEYCNATEGSWAQMRAADGYPNPLNVRYWSIGNENWGGHEIGARTPQEWGPLVLRSAELMRTADPGLKLLAAATADPNWTLPLLKTAGNQLQYVAIHEYWLPCWGENLMPDYRTCILNSTGPERTITRVIDLLKEAGYGDRIMIAFDEWNLRGWHHPGFPRKQVTQANDSGVTELIRARDKNAIASQYTMADALFSASFLNACLRHSAQVGMANIAPILNTRGPLFVHPAGLVKRTTFHVLAMYANELQNRVAKLNLDSGRLAGGDKSVPLVDAVATVDDSGKHWALALVNRHPEQGVACTVKLGDVPVEGGQSASVLAGDSAEAYNDLEHPNRVAPQPSQLTFTNGVVVLAPHSLTVVKFTSK